MSTLIEGNITWAEASAIADNYKQVLDREFQGHQLIVDKHGTIRWLANPVQEQAIMERFDATDLNELFRNGVDKNDPLVRELYKHLGYSLSRFWEVFYWNLNNEEADDYQGRLDYKPSDNTDMGGKTILVGDQVGATPPDYKITIKCKVDTFIDNNLVKLTYDKGEKYFVCDKSETVRI